MTASVRQADRDDIAALAWVHLATVTVAYAGFFPSDARVPTLEDLAHDWSEAFDDATLSAYVASDGTQPVGTVAIRSDPDFDGCGQLRRVHVLPDRWGSGIGSALHDMAVSRIRDDGFDEAGLWVVKDNTRARRFYETKRWTQVADRALDWPALGVSEVRYRLPIH